MPDLLRRLPLLFLAVLTAAVLASLWLRFQFDFNAGHMDEYDYLFVGKRLLAGETWPSYTYIFGSNLNWYFLGLGDHWLGGLSGARMIAGMFGLLSLTGLYCLAYCLWQRHLTAVVAVVLLSIQSMQLFISRFATYDIISFAYFSLALAPLWLACTKQRREKYIYLLVATILMSLAITSKYILILYLPLIAGLALLYARWIGFLFSAAVGSVILVYGLIHWEALQVLYRIQIQGVHGTGNSNAEYILLTIATYLSALIMVWLLAVLWLIWKKPYAFWQQAEFKKIILLLLLAFPMGAYHFNALNMISLFKHLVYAALFLTPAVAWLLTNLAESAKFNWLKQVLASGFIVAVCLINYQQLKLMETAYANVNPVIEFANSGLNIKDTILSEDPYLFRYLGEGRIPQSQIKESGWLDSNLDGKHEQQDVIDAVWDMKFDYVFLNDQLHPKLNDKLREILRIKNYKPLVDDRYHISNVMSRQVTGKLSLYQRIPLKSEKLSEN